MTSAVVTIPPLVDIQPPFNDFTTTVSAEWQPVAESLSVPAEVFVPATAAISPDAIPSQMTITV